MPLLQRLDWLSRQARLGRALHITFGRALDPGKLKVKCILQPSDGGNMGSIVPAMEATIDFVKSLVLSSSSMDRGHRHSDGTSIVCFWISCGSSPLDSGLHLDASLDVTAVHSTIPDVPSATAKRRCKRCGQPGHDARTCVAPRPLDVSPSEEVGASSSLGDGLLRKRLRSKTTLSFGTMVGNEPVDTLLAPPITSVVAPPETPDWFLIDDVPSPDIAVFFYIDGFDSDYGCCSKTLTPNTTVSDLLEHGCDCFGLEDTPSSIEVNCTSYTSVDGSVALGDLAIARIANVFLMVGNDAPS